MKFLCGNCKAKYQIADEKIAGRTLRMKCRRCSHDIVIRGGEEAGRPDATSRTATGGGGGARRKGGSSVGPVPQRAARKPAGSALGADFRRQVSSGAPDVPPERPGTLDQWHVAINDVPVGPIKRDEVARKVAAGAVHGESLCWREGFDDWRPLREIPELAAVLGSRVPASPPQPAKPMGRGMGGGARGGTGARPRPRPASRSGAGVPSRPAASSESARPAARSNVVPIGGRLGAAAAPAFEEQLDSFDDLEGEPTRVSDPLFDPDQVGKGRVAPPAPMASPGASFELPGAPPAAEGSQPLFTAAPPMGDSPIPRAQRRGLPIGAWIAIAGAGAFGMMLAAMVGTKILSDDGEQTAAAPEPQAESRSAEPDQVEAVVEVPIEEEIAEGSAEAEQPGEQGGQRRRAATNRRPASAPAAGGGSKTKQLSAEEQELLRRMGGGGGSASPAKIQVSDRSSQDRNTGEGLNAQQLRSVVGRHQPALRRCYETAIRGMGEPPTVRMDVDITIGSSGRVTRVNARGRDVGGLAACIESSVRRWTFPSSGNTTPTSFPVVFQPGG